MVALNTEERNWELEFGRHNADDRVTAAIQKKRFADKKRIGIKPALPQSLTDDDDIVVSFALFFAGKSAAFDRFDAEQGKQCRRHDRSGDSFWEIAAAEIKRFVVKGGDVRAAVKLILQIEIFGRRNRNSIETLGRKSFPEEDQLGRLLVRQRSDQQRVDQAEHRRVCADGQRQSCDRNGREAGCFHQSPQRHFNFAQHRKMSISRSFVTKRFYWVQPHRRPCGKITSE